LFHRAMVSYKTDNTRDKVIIFIGKMKIVADDKGIPIRSRIL
jgi:hypothetical protein